MKVVGVKFPAVVERRGGGGDEWYVGLDVRGRYEIPLIGQRVTISWEKTESPHTCPRMEEYDRFLIWKDGWNVAQKSNGVIVMSVLYCPYCGKELSQ
jgi:hypothetical protein